MVYITVADCAATASKVTEIGGLVRVPPTEIHVGEFSVLGDSKGATFSIIEMAGPQ